MSNYRHADTKTQWFQDNYPGSVLNLSSSTAVVCLHTTESTGWPGYEGGATAPNYTARPNFSRMWLEWRAHFPDERSSRALRNLAGGVETNTLNVVQVELVGTCNPAHKDSWNGLRAGEDYIYWPDAPDWALRAVGRFLADQHERHGLKLRAPKFVAYPASYGNHSERFTFSEWRNFAGVCGHQHVPENSHGDPGNINITRILNVAREMVSPPPVLRLVSANLHHDYPGYKARIKNLKALQPDVVFVSEGRDLSDELHEAFPKHRIVENMRNRHAEDVKLLLGPDVTLVAKGTFQATRHVEDQGGWGNERWVAWAKVRWQGRRFLLVSVHFNAVVQNKDGSAKYGLARVRQFRREIKRIERFVENRVTWEPIIAGDVNWKRREPSWLDWFYAPDRMFRRLGLKTFGMRTPDRIAYPKDLNVADIYLTPKSDGADHHWIVMDIEADK